MHNILLCKETSCYGNFNRLNVQTLKQERLEPYAAEVLHGYVSLQDYQSFAKVGGTGIDLSADSPNLVLPVLILSSIYCLPLSVVVVRKITLELSGWKCMILRKFCEKNVFEV